jgi:hypothetical protein
MPDVPISASSPHHHPDFLKRKDFTKSMKFMPYSKDVPHYHPRIKVSLAKKSKNRHP